MSRISLEPSKSAKEHGLKSMACGLDKMPYPHWFYCLYFEHSNFSKDYVTTEERSCLFRDGEEVSIMVGSGLPWDTCSRGQLLEAINKYANMDCDRAKHVHHQISLDYDPADGIENFPAYVWETSNDESSV